MFLADMPPLDVDAQQPLQRIEAGIQAVGTGYEPLIQVERDRDGRLLAQVMQAGQDSPLILADNGWTDYEIVVGSEPDAAVTYAARELAYFLKRATGASFPIVSAASPTDSSTIVLREQAATEPVDLAVARSSLGEDGFALRTRDSRLYILGGSPRGILYGVYYFLEQYLGYRWFSSEFTVVPRAKRIALDPINVTQTPRFSYREVFSGDADDPAFSAHNRLNGQLGHRVDQKLRGFHGGSVDVRSLGAYRLVPPERYRQTHPEYYGAGQLRYANSAVREIAIEAVKEQLARWPKEPYYLLISHVDRSTYYRKGKDGELIDRFGAPGAAFMDFVRDIAEAIEEPYPQVTVLGQAYHWSRQPPKGMGLPDNMGVMISDIELDFSKPMDTGANQVFLDDLDGWARLTDQIIVWDYITNFSRYIQPHPNLQVLGPNLKLLAKRPEVIGVFEQGAYGTQGGEFATLRAWVLAKLLWNPKQDADRLIETFVEGYYGPAAPYVQRYIELLKAKGRTMDTQLGTHNPPTATYLDGPLLRQADVLFEKAERAVADDPAFRAHVRAIRMAVDYAILVNRARLHQATEQSGQEWQPDSDRYARFARYLDIAGVTSYGEDKRDIVALLETLKIDRGGGGQSSPCRGYGPSACSVVQDVGLRLAGDAEIVMDAAASDSAAARMGGGSPVWGIQLPLEQLLPADGKWTVSVSARVEGAAKEGQALAMRLGIYPGVQRQIRVSEVSDGQYHDFELPRQWRRDSDRSVWIAPPNSNAIKALYVDSVSATRVE